MSAKIQLGSILGSLVLLVIIGTVVITGSKANEDNAIAAKNSAERAEAQSIQNNKDIQAVNQTLHHFLDLWTDRIKVGNNNTNTTQRLIVDTQTNLLHNLTEHRNVTNQTRDVALNLTREIQAQNNLIIELLNNQSDLINKNSSDEHVVIFKALNISTTDDETDAESESDNLGQLLKDFIQEQKDNGNKTK